MPFGGLFLGGNPNIADDFLADIYCLLKSFHSLGLQVPDRLLPVAGSAYTFS